MERTWQSEVDDFIRLAQDYGVRMIMVGGGAVNFHGYQRHSADVDFWIDTKDENLKNLIKVFNEMGYEISDFPKEVKEHQQNISVKLSPTDLNIELITRFSINKSFDEAYKDSVKVKIEGENEKFDILTWNVLSYDDLITSKIKSGRPKDLLDIQQLQLLKDKPE